MKSNATNVNNADDSVKESYNVDVTKYYKQVSIVTSLVVLVAMVITPIASTIQCHAYMCSVGVLFRILTCLVGVSFLLLKNVQNKFPSNIMLLIVFVVFWSISINLLCCNLSLQHVISTWAISIGVCIAGVLVGMIIEIDLTKYIIPQGIYTLVCLFVSKILAFILFRQNNQSFAFNLCVVGTTLAIFQATITVGQAVIKDGYINFRGKYAFSAFIFIQMVIFIYSNVTFAYQVFHAKKADTY